MKGVILAGGVNSRLFPITFSITKQLLPVYDKPMIYYAISTLMNASIRDILIIVSPAYLNNFMNLLSDGSQFGINISYAVQNESNGIPEAFIIGEEFINNDKVALLLGDNIFYGDKFLEDLTESSKKFNNSMLFLYNSPSPYDFGVVEFSGDKIVSIEEKPINPKSNYVVTGLYFYDQNAPYYSKTLSKSLRGELEISDLNNIYLKNHTIDYKVMDNNSKWFDTGTVESLNLACNFVKDLYKEGIKLGVLEEIAYKNGWISSYELEKQAFKHKGNSYGKYLNQLINY